MMKNNIKEINNIAKKLIFLGLDAAGKTSIILTLMKELSKIAVIAPTKGAQRRVYEFLDIKIHEWDLGGQVKYREDYLKNPDLIFDFTDIAIYVIDIQNKIRVAECLTYLNDIITQFRKLQIEPPIYIFLHKNDPNIVESIQEELNNLSEYLINKIKEISNYDKFFFFKTSIFNLTTIINAMSTILLSLYPKADLLKKTMEQFTKKFRAEGIEIIDNHSLIVASYYKNEEVKELVNSSTHYFLKLSELFDKSNIVSDKSANVMQVQRFGKFFLFKPFSLREGAPIYYLLLFKNDQIFNMDEFNALVNILKEILYK